MVKWMDREKVISGLHYIGGFIAERIGIEQARNFLRTIDDALALLKEQEQIVRCKDCHYGIRNSNEDIFCIKAIYNDKYKRPEWFCADGERKEEE